MRTDRWLIIRDAPGQPVTVLAAADDYHRALAMFGEACQRFDGVRIIPHPEHVASLLLETDADDQGGPEPTRPDAGPRRLRRITAMTLRRLAGALDRRASRLLGEDAKGEDDAQGDADAQPWRRITALALMHLAGALGAVFWIEGTELRVRVPDRFPATGAVRAAMAHYEPELLEFARAGYRDALWAEVLRRPIGGAAA